MLISSDWVIRISNPSLQHLKALVLHTHKSKLIEQQTIWVFGHCLDWLPQAKWGGKFVFKKNNCLSVTQAAGTIFKKFTTILFFLIWRKCAKYSRQSCLCLSRKGKQKVCKKNTPRIKRLCYLCVKGFFLLFPAAKNKKGQRIS